MICELTHRQSVYDSVLAASHNKTLHGIWLFFRWGSNPRCLVYNDCNWPNSQIPECTSYTSHNTPFRTEICTFLFWMEHFGIWNRCILGFVKLVYCFAPILTFGHTIYIVWYSGEEFSIQFLPLFLSLHITQIFPSFSHNANLLWNNL